jgi:hypothetical protein
MKAESVFHCDRFHRAFVNADATFGADTAVNMSLAVIIHTDGFCRAGLNTRFATGAFFFVYTCGHEIRSLKKSSYSVKSCRMAI